MNSFLEITLLLDYYGQLITKKQFEALDYHYNNDYSLGEISKELNITRQAVHDTIKKGIITLRKYNNCLKMIEKDNYNSELLKNIKKNIQAINIMKLDKDTREKIERVNKLLKKGD